MATSTLRRRSGLAMAGATAGLATLLTPAAAHAAPQLSAVDETASQAVDVAALPASVANRTTAQSPRTAPTAVSGAPAQAPAPWSTAPTPAVPDADSAGTAAAWVCKRVTAREVRVWKTAATTDPANTWGVWRTGTQFWTDGTDPPYNRYHTILSNGGHAWVTSDSRYVTSC